MALWITASDPLELRAHATEEDLQAVIRAVYRQIFGNHYVMDSQRLTSAESLLRNGDVTVRGFVRLLANSELYQTLFFESASPYRFIELNFQHLLGRAPTDQAEVARHVQLYNAQGYAAEIDSYLDSAEYQSAFGENVVPYVRGSQTQAGLKTVDFNRTFALLRGFATTSAGKSARLISDVAANLPTKITAPVSRAGAYTNTRKRFRITVSQASYGPRVPRSTLTVEVGYNQLSAKIQNFQRAGGKILSVSQVA